MEVSFQKTPAADQPVIDIQASEVTAPPATPTVDTAPVAVIPTAPVVAPAPALPVTQRNPIQLDDDNIGFEEVILPRLNIVQKVGDLSTIFPGGNIVFNQEIIVHEQAFIHADNPALNKPGSGVLNVTVLGFRKRQFTEKVEGGKLGMLVNTESDVVRNGGTLDYKEWEASVAASKQSGGPAPKKLFQRLATALVLVERPSIVPDEDHILFPYEFGGKYYALALWSMKGTSYTHAAKPMFTAKKIGHLKTGYTGGQWSVTTKLEKFGSNWAYVPVVKPGAKNSDEFRQFCRDILGSGN